LGGTARHDAADEILVRVVDRALDEYFKRDKLWRKAMDAVLSETAVSLANPQGRLDRGAGDRGA
jgi:hypothetical protein